MGFKKIAPEEIEILLPSIHAYQEELTQHAEGEDYHRILKEVIHQYRSKNDLTKILLPFYSDDIKSKVIHHIKTLKRYEKEFAELTLREEEVLYHLANGDTRNEIAHQLGCSPSTIKKHCENIYKKIGTNDRLIFQDIVAAYMEC